MKNQITVCLTALFIFPIVALAGLTITVSTTVIDTNLGYASGEEVTFTFELNPDFGNNSSSQFGNGSASWIEETTSEDQLYPQVSGGLFKGEYTRPNASSTDPYSKLEVWWADDFARAFEVRIAADESDIGLRTPSDAAITTILMRLSDVTDFPPTSEYVSPSEYLDQLLGNYTGMSGTVEVRTSESEAYLRVTSMTIANEATPDFDLTGWTWNDYYPWVFSSDHGWLYFLPTHDGLWIQKASTGEWILKE